MMAAAADARRDASVEPSEHHTEQSDKDDGADQDPGGSRVHACSCQSMLDVNRFNKVR
jgi:hypothetical protein